ncbi:hypothetical protein L0156_06495 [bacterium]|nr:hypothetical protein [bacterium]
MKLRILLVILFAFTATNLFAKTEKGRWCGTKRGTSQTEYMIKENDRHRKGVQAKRVSQQQQPPHINEDVGEIAVIEGSPSTIIQPNSFDLQGKKILLNEAAGIYKLRVRGGSVAGSQGSAITLGDDDSEQVNFTSGFSFPFFGTTYTSVFINSDGNLTFTEKDDASTPRDLFRTLQGPPRVAPFFADLDPSDGGEVRVLQSGTKFRVTWVDVPEFGTNNLNTIQVTLYKRGHIQIVYGSQVDGDDAVIGISPGNTGPGSALFVDYSTVNPTPNIGDAVIERFASRKDLDYVGIIQEFHSTHPGIFELITIFTDRFWLSGTGAFAFFSAVKNQDEGIGRGIFDFSKFFGSDKLEGFLMMDNINKYPVDVHQNFLGTNNTLDIMGQEMGHRWLAFPRAVIGGVTSTEILGRDESHWSWFLDSDASDMEGNNWQDNGNNSFTSIEATERYSALDRYIMGLIPPSAVPPFFVLRGGGNPAAAPEEGITITASRVNVTVDDIIAAEGPRDPTSANAKKKWRVAFIFFVDSGNTPDPALIARVDEIRRAWKPYFKSATGGKGKVITKLP